MLNIFKTMKTSFDIIWDFLAPSEQYADRKEACRRLWASLPLSKQRQIYATLCWQKAQGVEIDENPYFAINHCTPRPFNYNGANVGLPDAKMVIAKYNGSYGLFTKRDAEAFEMVDKRAFN